MRVSTNYIPMYVLCALLNLIITFHLKYKSGNISITCLSQFYPNATWFDLRQILMFCKNPIQKNVMYFMWWLIKLFKILLCRFTFRLHNNIAQIWKINLNLSNRGIKLFKYLLVCVGFLNISLQSLKKTGID